MVELLPISDSDLDAFISTPFSIPPAFTEASGLDLLIQASVTFAKEFSKKLESVTGDSPVYLAVKALGLQYQKTAGPSGLLLPLAETIRQSSELNHSSVLQAGNQIQPTITKVIGGLSAFSKAKDDASKRALGDAFLNFLEPISSLMTVFEKCTAGEIIKSQKTILDTLHSIISSLGAPETTTESPAFQALVSSLAHTITLLTHLVRRKALNLPTNEHPQYPLFLSCMNLESSFGDFIHEALDQAAAGESRDPTQAKLKTLTRSICLEFTQIYATLNVSYPDDTHQFAYPSSSMYSLAIDLARSLAESFRKCNNPELACFPGLLDKVALELAPLIDAGHTSPVPIISLTDAFSELVSRTIADIKKMISTMIKDLDDKVLYRHFDLFLDSLSHHQLQLQLSAAHHIALLTSLQDPGTRAATKISPMSFPHAVYYSLSSYTDFARTLLTVFTIEDSTFE